MKQNKANPANGTGCGNNPSMPVIGCKDTTISPDGQRHIGTSAKAETRSVSKKRQAVHKYVRDKIAKQITLDGREDAEMVRRITEREIISVQTKITGAINSSATLREINSVIYKAVWHVALIIIDTINIRASIKSHLASEDENTFGTNHNTPVD